jgi:hypothetical protein
MAMENAIDDVNKIQGQPWMGHWDYLRSLSKNLSFFAGHLADWSCFLLKISIYRFYEDLPIKDGAFPGYLRLTMN